MMELSIIFVNYKSSRLIIASIGSILKYTPAHLFEFIVIDNSSGLQEKEEVCSAFPQVKWVSMDYNAGFARANNAGIRISQAPIVLLLNPDTLAIDDSISGCTKKFQSSEYVACGVQLLNEDEHPEISGNFFIKGGLNHLLPLPYWGNFLRWIAFKIKTPIPNVRQAKAEEEVDWISGAFLMVKKDAINKAGLMDEDFFLYAEEVEWCSRLRKLGKLCIYGDFHFIHLQGESGAGEATQTEKGYAHISGRKGLQIMLSNHVRVRKQFGRGWFLFLLLNYTWGVLVFFIAGFFHRLLSFKNPFSHWPKCFAFAKNVIYIWRLSPVILKAKPYFYKVL